MLGAGWPRIEIEPPARVRHKSFRVVCVFVLAMSVAPQAWTSDSDGAGAFGSVTLTSDYVDRGISKSKGHAALQGEIGWLTTTGLIASISGSSVDFDDGSRATTELNYLVGLAADTETLSGDVQLVYVDYPGAISAYGYDHFELAGHAEQEIAAYALDLEAIFSKDDSADVKHVLYVSTGLARAIGSHLRVRVHLGREWAQWIGPANATYMNWGVASEFVREQVRFGITYTNTNIRQSCAGVCDGRIAAFIRAEF
jgi:uncharacterized protein (TIGR02001 family)